MENNNEPQENYPVNLEVSFPGNPSRGLAFLTLLLLIPKLIILLPHIVILYFLGIASFVAAIFAQIIVLFSGSYPRSFFNFVIGTYRWQLRMNMYLVGATDKYPPFKLEK